MKLIIISMGLIFLSACSKPEVQSGEKPPTEAEIVIMKKCDFMKKWCRFNGDVDPCIQIKLAPGSPDPVLFYNTFCKTKS